MTTNLSKNAVMGAVIGDIVGSRFEFWPYKGKDFTFWGSPDEEQLADCYFTDDTVLSLAIADALFQCDGNYDTLREKTAERMRYFGRKYHDRGYGSSFKRWLRSDCGIPYMSYGNGSAMRVSAVAHFATSLEQVKQLSLAVTDVTHNHPEGIKGAEAVAVCIWMALHGASKEQIKTCVEQNYYSLNFDYDDLMQNYTFSGSCQGTVPQSIFAFLIANDFEDTVRTAVSLGGDADTMACIAGSIAAAFYGVPSKTANEAKSYLPQDLLQILEKTELKAENAQKTDDN